ncbi:MAG: C_GCAxxG_C_C family protein [Desulfobacterium sp.]|nr:C_GCAxxG_C_C family protein [Desulfobacterium sp.]
MNMIAAEEKKSIGARAGDYFGNGCHCAEAVTKAVLEEMGEDPSQALACATAFGGGFGKSFEEACGALSGALIAIGQLHGRQKYGGEWEIAADLGAQIRQQFVNDFGTTHCASLRDRFGEEHQMDECRKVVERVTTSLLEILTE